MNGENVLKILFELGVLSRTPRTGPYHVGITDQETIAAHSFRTSALAYFVAHEESADVSKVLKMALVHDFPETRLLNQTFVQEKSYSVKEKMPAVLKEQLRNVKGSEELQQLFEELQKNETKEAKIVNDASVLESLIEAKELVKQGKNIMERWFLEKKEKLNTETARKLFDILEKEKIFWWDDV